MPVMSDRISIFATMSDFRLKVFRSAARHLSFTKASEELYVSQPSVTRHIRELETEYGQRLFERTGGRLLLTQAGVRMLEHVERILEAYSALEYEMKKISGESGGTLRLGASTTIAQYVLPRALALFSQDRRQTSIYLRNGNTEEIEQALLAHEIDLGLVEGGSRQRVLNYIPFMKDELVAVVRTHNRLNLPEVTNEEIFWHTTLVFITEKFGDQQTGCGAKHLSGYKKVYFLSHIGKNRHGNYHEIWNAIGYQEEY